MLKYILPPPGRIAGSIVGAVAIAAVAMAGLSAPSVADEAAAMSAEQTYGDVEATLGVVPGFIKLFPQAGIAGAWAELKAMEFSDQTALSPKVKALISLAVAAQIPCSYCVWADTGSARAAGATDEEIAEAVAIAALTRHWSTFLNGMQIDLETFKKELGGGMPAAN